MWTTAQLKSGAVTALCFTADSFYLFSGSAQGIKDPYSEKIFELEKTKSVNHNNKRKDKQLLIITNRKRITFLIVVYLQTTHLYVERNSKIK